MMASFYYKDQNAVGRLYFQNNFPIVSFFPREETNLEEKAFWQSILVLVVKWRHHANSVLKFPLIQDYLHRALNNWALVLKERPLRVRGGVGSKMRGRRYALNIGAFESENTNT